MEGEEIFDGVGQTLERAPDAIVFEFVVNDFGGADGLLGEGDGEGVVAGAEGFETSDEALDEFFAGEFFGSESLVAAR